MTIKQRVFQAILFEIIALLLSYGLIKLFSQATAITPHNTQTNDSAVWLMLLGISLIAMIWTFIYNLIFDKLFPGKKLSRPVWLRALHVIGFEGGLLCLTLPLVMWVLHIGFWQALLMDISLSLLILVYGFIFYWVYDWLWAKFYDKA